MTSWMIISPALTALRALDEPLARTFFDRPDAYVLGAGQPGWATTLTRGFRSFASYAQAGDLAAAVYDAETWPETTPIEQLHPKAYMQAFADLAHARKTLAIVAPSPDLLQLRAADCFRRDGETVSQAYVRCQIPAAAAAADVLSVQSQPVQSDGTAYLAMISGARTQRPDGALWAGLTTMRGDPSGVLVSAYRAVDGLADGFWLNTTADTIQVAYKFLRAIS